MKSIKLVLFVFSLSSLSHVHAQQRFDKNFKTEKTCVLKVFETLDASKREARIQTLMDSCKLLKHVSECIVDESTTIEGCLMDGEVGVPRPTGGGISSG